MVEEGRIERCFGPSGLRLRGKAEVKRGKEGGGMRLLVLDMLANI